jgi:hypothetical protein
VIVTSRTFLASNHWIRPFEDAFTRSAVEAITSRRSVSTRSFTDGLTGVTNGSPWFGRLNGVSRLTQGIQRYASTMPLTFVKSQFEPVRDERSVERYWTRTLAVAPAGRMPPSGTMTVWSWTLRATGLPSTSTARNSMPPRRAAIVLNSTRSMGPPDVLVMVAVELTEKAREP